MAIFLGRSRGAVLFGYTSGRSNLWNKICPKLKHVTFFIELEHFPPKS